MLRLRSCLIAEILLDSNHGDETPELNYLLNYNVHCEFEFLNAMTTNEFLYFISFFIWWEYEEEAGGDINEIQ